MPEETTEEASFRHEAMHTVFMLRFRGESATAPAILAGECFRLLDELEAHLSRFRPDSDVARIAQLKAGESLWVAEATADCLRLALQAQVETGGLFDAAIPEPGEPRGELHIHPEKPFVQCTCPPCRIDLGGIAKGFALDQMAAHLQTLGCRSALLSAGASTHLAYGPDTWPLRVAATGKLYQLKNAALSHSGIEQQGSHIRHPDTGVAPDYAREQVTRQAASAALADAYSTAALLMHAEELIRPKKQPASAQFRCVSDLGFPLVSSTS
ncbi:MAG: FAD:protein FMN transferase [Opitutales bacterium]